VKTLYKQFMVLPAQDELTLSIYDIYDTA
jgi:hypothetical protein